MDSETGMVLKPQITQRTIFQLFYIVSVNCLEKALRLPFIFFAVWDTSFLLKGIYYFW